MGSLHHHGNFTIWHCYSKCPTSSFQIWEYFSNHPDHIFSLRSHARWKLSQHISTWQVCHCFWRMDKWGYTLSFALFATFPDQYLLSYGRYLVSFPPMGDIWNYWLQMSNASSQNWLEPEIHGVWDLVRMKFLQRFKLLDPASQSRYSSSCVQAGQSILWTNGAFSLRRYCTISRVYSVAPSSLF